MTQHSTDRLPAAGLVRRLLCIVYDLLLIIALVFIASIPPVVLLTPPMSDAQALRPAFYEGDLLLRLGFYAYLLAVVYVFYGWFWTHGGQSLGMKTWGVRVERFDGGQLGWGDALKRYLWALVSWALLGGGFLLSLVRADRLALHDLYSGTRLVYLRAGRKPAGERAGDDVDHG
ncbi:MAG: RDD family protein [Gammaproteobacteria bacterium]|nr:RDD family protein [Gammaproteobacteria bacterium]MDX5375842.1 RDD family protein [Gammaproteobacteria bacterium]